MNPSKQTARDGQKDGTMTTRHETDMRLCVKLARECDKSALEIVEAVRKLNRESRTLHRLAEEDCNRGLSETEHKRCAAARARAMKIAREFKVGIEFRDDPRAGCGIVVEVIDGAQYFMANGRGI